MTRCSMKVTTLAVAAGVSVQLILGGSAAAQINNGDFSAGGAGWTVASPGGFWVVEFLPVDGNPDGHAHMHSPFGNSEGEACISQVFDCGTPGDPGVCGITLDYRHETWDSGPLAGRVRVFLDGQLVHTSPSEDVQPWTTIELSTPCGTHEIALCLQVDAGNNGWDAGFDNVTAQCKSSCPWDCGGDNDGDVGIVDFLAVLAQWDMVGTSCDFDGGGVGIIDFLKLLANWGPCP